MDLEVLIKYLMWVAFFVIALAGLYFLLKKFGILG
jgi:hypothetical protein